jgi:hypothetical protein
MLNFLDYNAREIKRSERHKGGRGGGGGNMGKIETMMKTKKERYMSYSFWKKEFSVAFNKSCKVLLWTVQKKLMIQKLN